MKCKYVVYGHDKKLGPKLYGVLRFKTPDRGWEVSIWACDINGDPADWPIEWEDQLTWREAIRLFKQYYRDYDRYVNGRR
jgi:hypothetical protein